MAAIELRVNKLWFFPVKIKNFGQLIQYTRTFCIVCWCLKIKEKNIFPICLGFEGATVGRPCTRTGEGCTGELRPLRVQGSVANSLQDFPARSAKNLGLF